LIFVGIASIIMCHRFLADATCSLGHDSTEKLMNRKLMCCDVLRCAVVIGALGLSACAAADARPNVIYLIADELGYFEPGFMGNRNIQTPHLDRLAKEGVVFRNLFAGSAVCAPTRCCLLTGKHSGHTSVRLNGGGTPLRVEEETIASVLKRRGYASGGFGKWGCGGRDSTGVPEKHGFDLFFGYYDQVHAHTYYPPYLIRNSEEVPLTGNHGGNTGPIYAHYQIHEAVLKFIREHRAGPFFAYLPYTPPHGNFDIPDSDPAWALYKDQPWPEPARRYAAMVSLVDRQMGEILALLKELGIDDNTVVFFSGDNGANDYFPTADQPRGIHSGNKNPQTGVEYRGKKGTLYEGGVRVPFAARWPGKIAPGRVSEHLGYFPDLLPTIAEITGATAPADIDGISIVPELLGAAAAGRPQPQHEYLYWEINGWTAIRQGQWRAVRPRPNQAWELYDLASDPSESKDLSAAQPDTLPRLIALAEKAHEPVREGTFTSTDRHERDRRAKFGKQDEPNAPELKAKPKNKAKAKAKAAP
jgi:arylsulfatase A-like enzyme